MNLVLIFTGKIWFYLRRDFKYNDIKGFNRCQPEITKFTKN